MQDGTSPFNKIVKSRRRCQQTFLSKGDKFSIPSKVYLSMFIDNDKDISIDYPTDLLLPYNNNVEAPVERETKPKMVNLDDVCNWIENHIFDFPWYDNEQGDFSSKDIANALRKAMEEQ